MMYLLIGAALCALFYLGFIKPHFYWRNRGVLQSSLWEIISDMFISLTWAETTAQTNVKVYSRFPNVRCYGIYQFTFPLLIIKDPELFKDLMVKHFDHFTDHRPFSASGTDLFWARNLFSLEGEKWKTMRNTLSPTFTSSKLRTMFTLMNRAAQQYTDYYEKDPKDIIELEVKDSIGRLTADIIATCAFGFHNNSIEDKNDEFYGNAKVGSSMVTYKNILILALNQTFPKIGKFCSFNLMPAHISQYFKHKVLDSMKQRKERNIHRPDMINLLMETRKEFALQESAKESPNQHNESSSSKTIKLSDEDIAAQVMLFILAGYDTVANFLTLLLYELALQPEIQKRLQDEIDDVLTKCEGNFTPEILTSMKYLDMVISESLRIHPGGYQLDRLCTKPYTIEPKLEGEKAIHLDKGDVVSLCLYGLHHDPRYYPNPERFDPERFNDENRKKIPNYAYVPFGLGPRNCIGYRFSVLELKLVIFNLISKFDILVTEKTVIPVKLVRSLLFVSARDGVHLAYRKRKLNK